MIAPLLQAYRSLTRFATWVVGFYASPLLHVVFTSVIAAAGFAYGFARGHLPELNVTITQSLLLGLVIIVFIEVYLNEVAQALTGQAPTPPGTPAPPTGLRITP